MAVFGVFVRLRGLGWAGTNAVQELEVGGFGLAHAPVDAFNRFAFDAFPRGGLHILRLRFTDLVLPLPLHLMHPTLLLVLSRLVHKGRWRRSVDHKSCRNLFGWNVWYAWLREGNEICHEFLGVAGVVDG